VVLKHLRDSERQDRRLPIGDLLAQSSLALALQ
jgi:hypothetical protein